MARLVARLWPDDPSLSIVDGLIDIARRLDIRVVAEGIETEVQQWAASLGRVSPSRKLSRQERR
jgi:EAL domain-containing protein (putative c-di-GMP-specific phosphodiesterase class I)